MCTDVDGIATMAPPKDFGRRLKAALRGTSGEPEGKAALRKAKAREAANKRQAKWRMAKRSKDALPAPAPPSCPGIASSTCPIGATGDVCDGHTAGVEADRSGYANDRSGYGNDVSRADRSVTAPEIDHMDMSPDRFGEMPDECDVDASDRSGSLAQADGIDAADRSGSWSQEAVDDTSDRSGTGGAAQGEGDVNSTLHQRQTWDELSPRTKNACLLGNWASGTAQVPDAAMRNFLENVLPELDQHELPGWKEITKLIFDADSMEEPIM